MSNVCILTDTTVQFPIPAFTGRERVHAQALHITIADKEYPRGEGLKISDLPLTLTDRSQVQVTAPSVAEFESMFISLGKRFDGIITILHSTALSDAFKNATTAAANIRGRVEISVIDSGTIATGLGLVVQTASAAAEEGKNVEEIEEIIREVLPRIYSIFCMQGMTYLEATGYLGHTQALMAEYLKVLQFFVLDNDTLTPTQKARNKRHLVDLMHEFIVEFPDLEHVAFLQAVPPFENEMRALRERLNEDYEDLQISEHTINLTLAAMIGPRSLAVFMLEEPLE